MKKNVRILFDEAAIAARNEKLAMEIATTPFDNLLVIAVLRGSFVFAADLIRALHHAGMSPQIEFIQLTSYREAITSSGQVDIVRDIDSDVRGRDVILIDDILESGRTLAFAKDLLAARGAKRVLTCVLLDKKDKRAVNIQADYVGFDCPDLFVVGYGMDVAHSFRELPFVGVVDHSISKSSDDPGRL
jgi:hypoxanthine phosphoribosyltransferase